MHRYYLCGSSKLIVSACLIAMFREEHFFPADDGVVTLLCGPPGLIEHAALPGLESMGFVKGENVFGF